jgi:3-hydroxybutyryl-CoA dehydrogenase
MKEIEKIGIVGFGVMGSQISQLCAQSGYSVIASDVDEKILKSGVEEIKTGRWGLDKAVEKGKIKKDEAEEVFQRISTTTELKQACQNADYVIEVVPENMELKKEIFKKMDENSGEDTILASNTSSLPITDIAAATERPDKVIGMHFFQPVAVLKLVEMVKGLLTSDETVDRSKEVATKIGRVIAVVKDTGMGFPSIRLSRALAMEAIKLVEEGVATPKDIDAILKYGYNHPMGQFEMSDWIGLEIRAKVWDEQYKITGDPIWRVPPILKQLLISGYKGDPKRWKGSKGGFYEFFGEER